MGILNEDLIFHPTPRCSLHGPCPNFEECSDCAFYTAPKKLPERDSKGRFCSSYKAPKLTEEVFNRPDCPKWAQWAAVDKYGLAYFFENKPSFVGSRWHDLKYGMYDQIPGGFYDM